MSVAIDDAWLGPGLVALRWWALLHVQVIWRQGVGPGWTVVAAGLAVVLGLSHGSASVTTGVDLGDPWLAAAAEVGLGGMIGLVVALPGHALIGAAGVNARVLGAAPGPWQALTVCLVGAVALRLGLHQPLLMAGEALHTAWPPGHPQVWMSTATTLPVARLAHAMALLALTLATPALLAGAVAEMTVRLWGVGPTVVGPVASTVAPWGRVAAALVATGASWAAYDMIWARRVLVEGVRAGSVGVEASL